MGIREEALDRRHRTKTNKAKNTTQKTKTDQQAYPP